MVFAQSAPIDLLFQDDFSDGDASGWLPLAPEACYFVNCNHQYEMLYAGFCNIDPGVLRGDVDGIYMSTSNYSVLLEGRGLCPSDYIGVMLRGPLSHTGYLLLLSYDNNDVNIYRQDGIGEWHRLATQPMPIMLYESYWILFQCDGCQLRGKVWSGELIPEPADWLVTASDCTYENPGFMGFVTGRYGSCGASRAQLDNVVVMALEDYEAQVPFDGTTVLEHSTWAGIKSTF